VFNFGGHSSPGFPLGGPLFLIYFNTIPRLNFPLKGLFLPLKGKLGLPKLRALFI